MTKLLHKNPCPGSHEIYNFGRPFLCHHYYIFILSDPRLGVCMDVCLEFFILLRIFSYSHGDVASIGEGLQILTYAQHLWLLSSEGSLACHTYCDMGHPFIMVISEDLLHSHLLPSIWQCSCRYLFYRLRSVVSSRVD